VTAVGQEKPYKSDFFQIPLEIAKAFNTWRYTPPVIVLGARN
jgi:hypothetical protein